ncbi:3-methyladenine DNA glycosylase AlkC [Dyadobacter koreensis]|uniref:3-methyladenine DNA glycosylase AlkC n=1 Tax=Dyadobacter koreensis TaxID=408657 RepID=A0A1H6XSM6_9BACT|nr:DNA alkylation repair protein [Dyadobacter koreensis]SEJ27870.1 3-methyladenine DNA glycosylase AlkC [Dyadobacter koreensis]
MSLIKDIYSPSFYGKFADVLAEAVPSFDKKKFIELIFNKDFNSMEWKERMKHTTRVFHEFMPADFPEAVKTIERIIARLRKNNFTDDNLAFIFFPDYVEVYGIEDLKTSAKAFEFITQFISCEFAVRPFIVKYNDQMIGYMVNWSMHESPKVRRLASEGSRPRLPWAMAIPELKKNPRAILPILENLKTDPSESVRRSVANSLNDIAKDNPKIVLDIALKWKGISKETDAIIKHGSRTLLKQGHSEILKHFGLDGAKVLVSDFKILTPHVKIGDSVDFSFSVKNDTAEPQVVRLEYAVYYYKANGQLSKKVFKISEKIFQPNEKVQILRKQSFRIITTRKFYIGQHKLSVIANGEEKTAAAFELID